MKSILYIQYTDPAAYPPLMHSSRLLFESGWKVNFLGVEASGPARDLKFSEQPAIGVQLLSSPRRGIAGLSDYLKYLRHCRSEILRTKPDVIYCSDFRSYPVGLWASYRTNALTVLHEHDTPQGPDSGVFKILGLIRKHFAVRATVCVLPQPDRAKAFQNATGVEQVSVVLNCPMLDEIRIRERALDGDRREFVIWYHGSIGPSQLPDSVVHALTLLPSQVKCEFAGYETASGTGYVDRLLTLAANLGVGERVKYRGRLPLRSDLLKLASQADIGLTLFSSRFREPMVGASNKPFDYLACGLPLLMNETEEWWSFFGAVGVGVSCNSNDAAGIASAVSELLGDPSKVCEMRAAGVRLINGPWNYEAQFQKVMARLAGSDVRV